MTEEQKPMQELLMFKEALDQHAIVSIADATGKITYVNDKFCQISRYSRNELIGQNHRLLKSGVHDAEFFDDMWLTISGGRTWHGEVCNRHKDGDLYWVNTTIVPGLDENGLPYQYVSVRTEITQLKLIEAALARSKAELEMQIKEQLTQFHWIGDLYRLGRRVAPDEQIEVVYQRILEHVVQYFGSPSGTLALIDKEVTLFDNDVNFTVVASVNFPAQLLPSGQDIFSVVARYGGDMLLNGDSCGDAGLIGLGKDKPVSAMCLMLREEERLIGILCLARTEEFLPYTQEDLSKSVIVTSLISMVVDNLRLHLESLQRIAMLSDINKELVLTSQQLNETQSHLMQSEKMASIGQLAAGVAHEINNPIGFVYSNLSVLERYLQDSLSMIDLYEKSESAISDPEVHARLSAAKVKLDIAFLKEDLHVLMVESMDGIIRVKNIVQNLKDFSHVDTSDEWHFSNLHNGIDSTLNMVNNEIKYKADVVREYGGQPEVECLPSQLNQVFMNLLVNASHAIEERGTITIRTGQQDNEAWVEIADTGKGIAEENLKKIFDPFFTTKPIGKGTGLGLSLSYGIIQKHHGRIEVQSEVGKGTTFRVWLPITQPLNTQARVKET